MTKRGRIREIPLTQGKVAFVDAADYEWLNQWKWYALLNQHGYHTWYAWRRDKRNMLSMHRQIMGTAPELVDHVNRDGLDNRRSNLRPATARTNQLNQRKHIDSKNPYKGIFHAGRGYCEMAREHYGEFARLA